MRALVELTIEKSSQIITIKLPMPDNYKGTRLLTELDKRIRQYAFDIEWDSWHLLKIENGKGFSMETKKP